MFLILQAIATVASNILLFGLAYGLWPVDWVNYVLVLVLTFLVGGLISYAESAYMQHLLTKFLGGNKQ